MPRGAAVQLVVLAGICRVALTANATGLFREGLVVTNQAMGARCAVAADFDGDGRPDLVSASSNDNAVSWYKSTVGSNGALAFSIKKQITWSSLGSRIVTAADIDLDGDIDVVGASYYDSTVRWFENDGTGKFTPRIISTAVNEGQVSIRRAMLVHARVHELPSDSYPPSVRQGVTVADVDQDGDPDIVTASSGDNTVAVFTNLYRGVFCEIKQVVDNNATGVRTVVAADLNGDGFPDLASASKDDDTVAWYPNNGNGTFPTKRIISAGYESQGAYSLVAADVDQDGDNDLIVASNGNDHVSLWRNDGTGSFTKTLIYGNADFVLSVTAVDFDRDGDIDVASASFFDGYIRWYENLDGKGMQWQNHTIYAGLQGHYVSHADMDGDGDDDLIAVTHAENTVRVFLAQTRCDGVKREDCCATGAVWNGSDCNPCARGTYVVRRRGLAECVECPASGFLPGLSLLPATCSGFVGIGSNDSVARCACPANTVKDSATDACLGCPAGQERKSDVVRSIDTLGNYTAWELQQGKCSLVRTYDYRPLIIALSVLGVVLAACLFLFYRRQVAQVQADAVWTIAASEIKYDEPASVLGRGTFGLVVKGYYRGTPVAVKQTMPGEDGSPWTLPATSYLDGTVGGTLSGDTVESPAFDTLRSSSGLSQGSEADRFNSAVTSKTKSRKKLKNDFMKEMRTLSKLRHPCITTVMGAVLTDSPLLVMECMGNGSLRDLLNNHTFPLDPELSLPLLRDILQGMRFLHAGDPPIVHGDLKCANVLVDQNYRAKISDFGLSAKRGTGYVGTPYWMAPELLQGGFISTRSDVYAFGVTLWEVMTRKLPYHDLEMSTREVLQEVKMGTRRPDCEQGLDKELVQCMQDCWAHAPEDRATFEDLEIKLIPLCGQNFFSVMQARHAHTRKQTSLLQDVFPEHIAQALLAGKKVEPENHDCVTVYFRYLSPLPSPLTPHPLLLTPHPSPLTPHLSPLTPHPSPLTPHPSPRSPLTPHPSPRSPLSPLGSSQARRGVPSLKPTWLSPANLDACPVPWRSDIVSFTTISGQLRPEEVSDMLDRLYTEFDDLAGLYPRPKFQPPCLALALLPSALS